MRLKVTAVNRISASLLTFKSAMFIEVEMTEGQMFDAMLSFAENIPSEAFHKFIDGFAKDGE